MPIDDVPHHVTVETETVPTLGVLGGNGALRVKRSGESAVPAGLSSAASVNGSLNAGVPPPGISPLPGGSAARKRSQRLAQASKADIFAAKVANAVDERDSSGSDETFVYDMPHSLRRTQTDPLETIESLDQQELLPSSTNAAQPPLSGGSSGANIGTSLGGVGGSGANAGFGAGQNGIEAANYSAATFSAGESPSRPRMFVVPTRSEDFRARSPTRETAFDSVRAKHGYLQRWRAPASSVSEAPSASESDERTGLLKARPSLYNYHTSRTRRQLSQSSLTVPELGAPETVGSLQEGALQHYAQQYAVRYAQQHANSAPPPPFAPAAPARCALVCSLLLVMLLFAAFVLGAFAALKRPLAMFDVVSLSDVVVSDRELVFSLITRARNPGLLPITISSGELDLFATSSYAKEDEEGTGPHAPRTLLLGSVLDLQSPITFAGGFSSVVQWRAASATLRCPLGNNTELWSAISAHEFDLTVRGVLTYDVFWSKTRETVSSSYHVSSS